MKHLLLLTLLVAFFLPLISTSAESENFQEAIEGLDPMDLSDVDSKVAGVLRKYYKYSFGDSLTWEAVESLRMEGVLELNGEKMDYVAYMKKPNCLKVVIHLKPSGRLVFGFDGKEAWQLNTLQPDAMPAIMAKADAASFARDAVMGGHLLYPQMEGKEFEFLGTALIEGDRVYELKTTLPDGQVIRSFFDMTSFAELYQISINNSNQKEELKINSDFRKINGIRSPFITSIKIDGEESQLLRTTDLQFNVGLMPWVFSRSHSSNAKGSTAGSKAALGTISIEPDPNSSFTVQGDDIWSTTSGVVGSAFQIESAGPSEDQGPSGVDDSNEAPEESKE